jgi:hypothetical protein
MNEIVIRTGLTIESTSQYDGVIIAGIDDTKQCHSFVLRLSSWDMEKIRNFINSTIDLRKVLEKNLEQVDREEYHNEGDM